MTWLALAGLLVSGPGCRDAREPGSATPAGQPAVSAPRDGSESESWQRVDTFSGPSPLGGPLSLWSQSNPGFCGLEGCAYRVTSEGAQGPNARALPHALACRFAEPQRRLPAGSVTCIQRVFTGIARYGPVQVEVDYELGAGGFTGALDHLQRDAPLQDCPIREVTAATPLYLLPVEDARFRSASHAEWMTGPPRIGALEPGTIAELDVFVIDGAGHQWLRVGAAGWVRAEALPCG
ncbi:MAG TPA: hypothetical protein VNM90_11750 [Haliangium sp.]|nr:hypothetical protein [Haliangium sp.]